MVIKSYERLLIHYEAQYMCPALSSLDEKTLRNEIRRKNLKRIGDNNSKTIRFSR